MQLFIFILEVGSGFSSLKGTVSQDFRHKKKTPIGPHMNRQKWFCKMFCFRKDILVEKCVSGLLLTTLTLKDYADAVSA